MNRRLIIICECPNAEQFTRDAHSLLFPDIEYPMMIKGAQMIRGFANTTFTGATKKTIKGLTYRKDVEKNEAFAYEIVLDDKDNIIELWDLYAGQRIK